jgi:uncharacterized protein YjbJ (UPF0337 family)
MCVIAEREPSARDNAVVISQESKMNPKDSLTEEVSAASQRAKGAVKQQAGEILDDPGLARRGAQENEEGRDRQDANRVSETVGNRRYEYYNDPDAANRAYEELRRKYPTEDIDVMMSDDTRRQHFENTEAGSKAAEGLSTGAVVGGGVGAALAAIFTVGAAVAIPGLGLVVAGPIAAALAGAGAGAATGGAIGALVGLGIPEDRAKKYEEGLRNGGVLIGSRTGDEVKTSERSDAPPDQANSMLGLR